MIFLALLLLSFKSQACTSFEYTNAVNNYMAKNFDFNIGNGVLLANPRNVEKKAFNLKGGHPVTWTSQYGSLTFNQVAQDFPYGGMNEKGLAVEILWYTQSEPPPDTDSRPTVNESQWIQYILDTSANLSEAASQAQKVRVATTFAPVHYFVCEKSGQCAVFENRSGQLKIFDGKNLPYKALANEGYPEEVVQGSKKASPRFSGAADAASIAPSSNALVYGFDHLNQVSQPGFTKWQIISDLSNQIVHFRNYGESSEKFVDLKKIDLQCSHATKALRLDTAKTGDVQGGFSSFGSSENAALLDVFDKNVAHFPSFVTQMANAYQQTNTSCKDAR